MALKAGCACKILEIGAELMNQAARMDRWQLQNYDFIVHGLSTPGARTELDTRWTVEVVNPYHKAVAAKLRELNDTCGTRFEKPEDEPPGSFVDDPEDYPHELLSQLCKQFKGGFPGIKGLEE